MGQFFAVKEEVNNIILFGRRAMTLMKGRVSTFQHCLTMLHITNGNAICINDGESEDNHNQISVIIGYI